MADVGAKESLGNATYLRRETREKLEAITSHRRWTLAETADAVADEYLSLHADIRVGAGNDDNTPNTVPAPGNPATESPSAVASESPPEAGSSAKAGGSV